MLVLVLEIDAGGRGDIQDVHGLLDANPGKEAEIRRSVDLLAEDWPEGIRNAWVRLENDRPIESNP
ncbi:MAG: hypothetical protein HY791_36880 [Deltaproteobacteria bacterium]|nr:hypothetical protein [Deltaproteobacteria bacterium]